MIQWWWDENLIIFSSRLGGEALEQVFNSVLTVFQNAFIVIWYWMNTYRWELLLLIGLIIVVLFEINEARVHFVDDKRKVV